MTHDETRTFFDRYQQALLARDAARIAGLYAVPGLILFPGQAIAVADRSQTKKFFAASFGQYEGITEVTHTLRVALEADHSVWADVTWSYGGEARERFCYQLVDGPSGPQIAVLTPLALS